MHLIRLLGEKHHALQKHEQHHLILDTDKDHPSIHPTKPTEAASALRALFTEAVLFKVGAAEYWSEDKKENELYK